MNTREQKAVYHRAYYLAHREESLAKDRAQRAARRDPRPGSTVVCPCVDCGTEFGAVLHPNRQRRATCDACRKERNRLKTARYRQRHGSSDADRAAAVERMRVWREANPERYRALQNQWAERNRDQTRAAQRRWRERYPERNVAKSQRRRALKAEAAGTHTAQEFAALCEQLAHQCFYCGAREKLTVDHVVPLSRGGSHYIDNIVPACQRCNSRKGRRTADEFMGVAA